MGLTAATYLGDNTVPILDALVASFGERDIDIAVDRGAGRSSADARAHASDVDLVWMCGSLAMVLLGDGVLDHDVVAAPVFADASDATYHSVFIARHDGPDSLDDALAGSIGLNEADSWSGHHGLRRHLGARWFSEDVGTGSHRGSIDAVATGRCDVAGIDVTVWNHVTVAEPDAVAELQVIGRTDEWPAPPFLVRRSADALVDALPGARVPGLDRIVPATAESYGSLLPD